MFYEMKTLCRPLVLAMSVIFCVGSAAIAQDAAWHIGKSSGDVWVTSAGAQQASLTNDAVLQPGDNIRTGRNGRVLLMRGAETMLISPNSVIEIPTEKTEGLATTIIQRAGSILLDVEKRNVKHFEVETPYLAAVVKGTQFRVSVNKDDSSVDVLRGEVEVDGFKSGQYATVLPGQVAKVAAHGWGFLSLSGSGTLSPIQQREPRKSSVTPVTVPKEGLPAPGDAPKGRQVRIVAPLGAIGLASALWAAPGGVTVSDAGAVSPIQQGQSNPSSSDRPPVPKEHLSAADSAPNGQRIRIAAAPGGVEAHPAWSGGNAADDNTDENANRNAWGFGFFAPGDGVRNASGHRNDLDKRTLGFVFGIGIAVAVAAGAKRRMQNKKQKLT